MKRDAWVSGPRSGAKTNARRKLKGPRRVGGWLPALSLFTVVLGLPLASRADDADRTSLTRLEQVHRDVARLGALSRSVTTAGPYQDARAVIHAHSYLSHDSRGTPEEIIAGAKKAGVRVIFTTDHYTDDRRFLREALRGERDGILFISGSELSQGLLTFRMERANWAPGASDAEVLTTLSKKGGVGFVAHPEKRTAWDLPFAGMEIYNTHADAEDSKPVIPSTADGSAGMARWLGLLEAARQYPRELFGSIFDIPTRNLEVWDRLNQTRRVVGIAGNDSHQNVGVTVLGAEGGRLEALDALGKSLGSLRARDLPLLLFGGEPTPGQPLLKVQLDPYDVSFGYVSTHLMVRSVTEKDCFEALTHGRCYVAFDWLADPTGFRFTGRVDHGSKRTDRGTPEGLHAAKRIAACRQAANLEMGDEMGARTTRLEAETPIPAELRLLHDGREIARESGLRLTGEVSEPGAYRVEAWLTVAGQPRPWIYSNPIFVRSQDR